MTDHHVHIGQFNEIYYDPHEVFEAISVSCKKSGIDEVHYSSTSSCRYDVELSKIEEEIEYAQKFKSSVLKIRPYFWAVPSYFTEKVKLESIMSRFDCCGLKIHPFAHSWDFNNFKHRIALEKIFLYAQENHKLILLHTGIDKQCRAERFEMFFKEFPNARVILAHSLPLIETINIIRKYKNVYSDISFVNDLSIKKMIDAGVKGKIVFGTDFPLTNYFSDKKLSFEKQYEQDCKNLNLII